MQISGFPQKRQQTGERREMAMEYGRMLAGMPGVYYFPPRVIYLFMILV